MSTVDPLAAIAASANDLCDLLADMGITPTPVKSASRKALKLPKGPSPATALRKLHLPDKSIKKICKIYDDRISSFRQAVIDEHKGLVEAAPKLTTKVSPIFKNYFTSTAKTMCKSVVDSASTAIDLMIQQVNLYQGNTDKIANRTTGSR
jgi:hypothetical protein